MPVTTHAHLDTLYHTILPQARANEVVKLRTSRQKFDALGDDAYFFRTTKKGSRAVCVPLPPPPLPPFPPGPKQSRWKREGKHKKEEKEPRKGNIPSFLTAFCLFLTSCRSSRHGFLRALSFAVMCACIWERTRTRTCTHIRTPARAHSSRPEASVTHTVASYRIDNNSLGTRIQTHSAQKFLRPRSKTILSAKGMHCPSKPTFSPRESSLLQ